MINCAIVHRPYSGMQLSLQTALFALDPLMKQRFRKQQLAAVQKTACRKQTRSLSTGPSSGVISVTCLLATIPQACVCMMEQQAKQDNLLDFFCV